MRAQRLARLGVATTILFGACGGTDHGTCVSAAADGAASVDSAATTDGTAASDLVLDSITGCAIPGTLVHYLQTTSTDLSDTRCGAVNNGVCTIDLQGFLFVPPNPSGGPLPAIIYNHGSEQLPGPKCSIAEYFVPKGYVVFVPHRRGHGKSTGLYVGNYTAGPQIDYLQLQVADVQAAYQFVAALSTPTIDAQRMAIAGHSYGGIMTLLTSAVSLGQRAAIDLCGDSESWNDSAFLAPLQTAVDQAKAPIFFLQPANDVHTEPTIELSHRAGTDGQQYQSTIYPPVPNATSPQDAHSRFVGDAAQVAIWGPAALDFLHRYGM